MSPQGPQAQGVYERVRDWQEERSGDCDAEEFVLKWNYFFVKLKK